jgi:hypothetical protein
MATLRSSPEWNADQTIWSDDRPSTGKRLVAVLSVAVRQYPPSRGIHLYNTDVDFLSGGWSVPDGTTLVQHAAYGESLGALRCR